MDEAPLAIVVAFIALVTSIVSAVIAKRATYFSARSGRFAEWQMYKRTTYADLLAAVRAMQADPTDAKRLAMAKQFDVARIAATPDLAEALIRLRRRLQVDPHTAINADDLEALLERMVRDVDTEPERRPGALRRARVTLRRRANTDEEYHGEE